MAGLALSITVAVIDYRMLQYTFASLLYTSFH